MSDNELALAAMVAGAIAGAFGARIGNAPLWKGAAIAIFAALCAMAIQTVLDVQGAGLLLAVQFILIGISGAVLSLTARQASFVAIGALLATSVFAMVAESVAKAST